MATISSAGLGSGLDINGIITKLMAVESQPLTTYAKKEASFQAKLSAFGSLKGALSTLQTAAKTLATASTFTGKSVTSSDNTVLAVSADSTASIGSYEIAVSKLAKAHSLISNTNFGTSTFDSGALRITVGTGTPTDINLTGNNTLSGIRDAINNAKAGVTASIINDGTAERLVLTSDTTGTSGNIAISATTTNNDGNYRLDALAADLSTQQASQDASFKVNGITVTSTSNTVTNAISGLTLKLLKADETTPPTTKVTVTNNTTAITSAVNAFVKAYNDAIGQIKALTAYDAENKKASALTGDSTARSIESQLSRLVGTAVTGVAGGISLLSDLGITIQKDGKLASDTGKLSAALADKDKDIAALFSQTTTGNEGIAVRFNTMLDGLIGTAGLISSRTDGINASIKDIQRRTEAFQDRLIQIESRYRKQFTALDSLIASMNQTSAYLSQQLANLPGSASNK